MSKLITKKNTIILIVIFAVCGITFAVISSYYSRHTFTAPENLHFNSKEEAYTYYKNLADAYKKDTYGDVTPEGTLKLFTQALEAKNINEASDYFIIEKQKDEKAFLESKLDANTLVAYSFILDQKTAATSTPDQTEAGTYEYDLNGTAGSAQINFTLNPYTNLWKINTISATSSVNATITPAQ